MPLDETFQLELEFLSYKKRIILYITCVIIPYFPRSLVLIFICRGISAVKSQSNRELWLFAGNSNQQTKSRCANSKINTPDTKQPNAN